ncbi:hypothetical protein [Halomonas sp. E14]|uniref:hypothetical protein n=1 Tax=Halomonas sp. E14 TaxID=3397245 RepID=UPI00403E42E7
MNPNATETMPLAYQLQLRCHVDCFRSKPFVAVFSECREEHVFVEVNKKLNSGLNGSADLDIGKRGLGRSEAALGWTKRKPLAVLQATLGLAGAA